MKPAGRAALVVIVMAAIGAIATVLHHTGTTSSRAPTIDAGIESSSVDVTTETPAGALLGIRTGMVSAFLGVPYALAPTGDARFRPPMPRPRASELIDARAAGALCPQIPLGAGLARRPDPEIVGDEDCLHLNVWTRLDGTARPVMVFLHGGAFQRSGGGEARFGESELVHGGDVVIVTIHYRLGVLGMIALESLAHENDSASTGNYGLRDQIAALEWVHANIASLGGDPSRITIFGESAGGESVCALVASPLAEGLFSRAIVQSGGGCARWPTLTEGVDGRLSGFARGAEIAAAAGCADAEDVATCMRNVDAESLVRAGTRGERRLHFPVFGPVIDGTVLIASTYDRLERGEVDVPLIIGSNADEAGAFMTFVGIEPETYEARLRQLAGPLTDAALPIWPVDLEATPRASFRRAFGELAFVCPAEDLARVAAGGAHPAYLYQFDRAMPGAWSARVGALHGVELFYLLAAANARASFAPSLEDRDVIVAMHDAWVGFAATGAPVTTPPWPAFATDSPAIYRIDSPSTVVADVSGGRCARARAAGIRMPL